MSTMKHTPGSTLEQIKDLVGDAMHEKNELLHTIAKLKAQRDELLEALKHIAIRSGENEPTDPEGNYDDARDYGIALGQYWCAIEAREAIQNATKP